MTRPTAEAGTWVGHRLQVGAAIWGWIPFLDFWLFVNCLDVLVAVTHTGMFSACVRIGVLDLLLGDRSFRLFDGRLAKGLGDWASSLMEVSLMMRASCLAWLDLGDGGFAFFFTARHCSQRGVLPSQLLRPFAHFTAMCGPRHLLH